MKRMRLAMWVAVFAVIGGIAVAEDLDIKALQAKLAAQEARLNDLQAKVNAGGAKVTNEASGVLSIRKNAVVTIGGTINTRYFINNGKVESMLPSTGLPVATPTEVTRAKTDYGDFKVSDANLGVKIDVNDYFDAYLQINGHDAVGRDNVSSIAQQAWVRWKNLCNSGFSVLVGRSNFVFGNPQPYGIRSGFAGGYDDFSTMNVTGGVYGNTGEGMFGGNAAWVPQHTGWDYSRTTQINPSWWNKEKTFGIEASIFEGLDRNTGTSNARYDAPTAGGYYDGATWVAYNYPTGKSFDSGPLSASLRLTWKPIEGLKLVASAVNFHTNLDYNNWRPGNEGRRGPYTDLGWDRVTSNNTAVNLAFQYRPCFFKRMEIWGQWTHDWNSGWVKDYDVDTLNAGIGFDINEQFSVFVQGDYMIARNKMATTWNKGNLWTAYMGARYKLPYGVMAEVGWEHSQGKYKNWLGIEHTKVTNDTVYGHLGFNF